MPTGVYQRATRLCDLEGCANKHFSLGYCRAHYHRFKSKGDPLAPASIDADTEPDGLRKCRTCEEGKPLSEFRVQVKGRLGRARTCKGCDQKVTSLWRSENGYDRRPEVYGRKILRTYGADGLLAQQRIDAGEICVCGNRAVAHIDHDHATGAVRGPLCHNCNTALGLVGDDPEVLRALIDYLLASREEIRHVV